MFDFDMCINETYLEYAGFEPKRLPSPTKQRGKGSPMDTTSANKAFDEEFGLVITLRNKARADYPKEDEALRTLRDFHFVPAFITRYKQHKYSLIDVFFSFQHAILESDQEYKNVGSFYERENEDIRRVSIFDEMTSEAYGHITTEKQLSFYVHQIMLIHFMLFMTRIRHGDMHMNNLKWMFNQPRSSLNEDNDGSSPQYQRFQKLRDSFASDPYISMESVVNENRFLVIGDDAPEAFYSIKAFDFGHASFETTGGRVNGHRYLDLRYLFNRKSQKKNRVFRWGETYDRSSAWKARNLGRMRKHFPFHNLMMNHGVNEFKTYSLNQADRYLERLGDDLVSRLRRHKNKETGNAIDCEHVLEIFTRTSNLLVDYLVKNKNPSYHDHRSGRYSM